MKRRLDKGNRLGASLLAMLASAFFLSSLFAVETPPERKLCWAHYVAWGFDQVGHHDRWYAHPEYLDAFCDRSLLGRNIQWDSGIYGGTKRQIESARLWGIDGFCVDVVDMAHIGSTMDRFHRAAEGTDFAIAPCIDNYRLDADGIIDALADYITRYRDRPNTATWNGRPVFFSYTLGLSSTDWHRVRTTLAERGLDAVYLLRPDRSELSNWSNEKPLAELLADAEGLYDFGCNGFDLDHMVTKLKNGRRAIQRYRPEGVVVAGIAPGYLGYSNSFYRPYMNSESVRNNWEAAIRSGSDWVCVTTWNDYGENTQFEPSVGNRTALLRINREYLRLWRGEKAPKRPHDVILNYHEETLEGDDFTLEAVSFSYDTPQATLHLRLLDETQTVLRLFDPIPLDREKMAVTTLRVTDEEMLGWKTVRVQAAITVEKAPGDSTEDIGNTTEPLWRELVPMVRRVCHLESLRTVRIPLSETLTVPITLASEQIEGKPGLSITLYTWAVAGRVELLRGGRPVGEQEISHIKSPYLTLHFPLPEPRSPREVFYARLNDSSDDVAWSAPITIVAPELDAAAETPILVTGSDFDEHWPIWSRRISRFETPKIERRSFAENEKFSFRFTLDKPEKLLISDTPWKIPLTLDSRETEPETVTLPDDSGVPRPALRFDGDDSGRLPTRLFPSGSYRIELLLAPELEKTQDEGLMPLYLDCDFALTLDAQNRPTLSDRGVTITSPEPIPSDRLSRLSAVCDLESLALYIDGKEVGRAEVALRKPTINSHPRLGVDNTGRHFRGVLAELKLDAGW